MKIKQLFTLALAAGISATSVAETIYDLDIINNASLTYSVASNQQNNIIVDASKTFKVDRKVVFVLSAPTTIGASSAIATQQNVAYALQNNSNAPIRFSLSVVDSNSGDTAHTPSVEDTTASNINPGYKVFHETSGNTQFDSGSDTEVTASYIELAPSDGVADSGPDETIIYVVSTPTIGVNDDIFIHTLTAIAQEPAGTLIDGATAGETITESAGGWNDAVTQTVFDTNGGTRLDKAAIQVTSANLEMIKTVTVLSDPINGISADAKAIPGAVVEYTLTVSNKGSEEATNVVISDDVPLTGFDLSDVYVELFSVKDGTGTVTNPIAGSGPSDVTVAANKVTFPALSVPAKILNGADGEVVVTLTATLK
jgi:uncharacterized repeat protein (TIGR01451 family)